MTVDVYWGRSGSKNQVKDDGHKGGDARKGVDLPSC